MEALFNFGNVTGKLMLLKMHKWLNLLNFYCAPLTIFIYLRKFNYAGA